MPADPMTQNPPENTHFYHAQLDPCLGFPYQKILAIFIYNHFLDCTCAADSETTLGKTLAMAA